LVKRAAAAAVTAEIAAASAVVMAAADMAVAEIASAAATDSAAAEIASAAAAVIAAAAAVVASAVAVAVAASAADAARRRRHASPGGWEGKGVVKFFNGQKGFGFIVRDDGGEDVFVHISSVEQAGLTGLAEGQPLEFTLVDRGGRISATDLKIEGEPMPVTDRGPPREREERAGGGGFGGGAGAGGPQRQLTGEKASGTVKFFNAMKGFGFISRDDGQPDAFVHISAVERAGMVSLNEGDRLEFELEVDRRGKTAAVNLSPIQ
jgi:cold shock CspA family protein